MSGRRSNGGATVKLLRLAPPNAVKSLKSLAEQQTAEQRRSSGATCAKCMISLGGAMRRSSGAKPILRMGCGPLRCPARHPLPGLVSSGRIAANKEGPTVRQKKRPPTVAAIQASRAVRWRRPLFQVADGELYHAPEHEGRRRDHENGASGKQDQVGHALIHFALRRARHAKGQL